MTDDKRMTCVTCNKSLAWPDGFPNSLYANCWRCTWNRHQSEEHPVKKVKKRWRRVEVAS